MSLKLRAYINEDYYARHNAPTFNQIAVQGYHFTDSVGRQYQLARRSDQVFSNTRVQFKPKTGKRTHSTVQTQHCVTNQLGYIKLYVKLAHRAPWFGASAVGRPLILSNPAYGELECRLKSTDRSDPRRATGAIYVKGLDMTICNKLINRITPDK